MKNRTRSSSAKQGFTMVELIAVLVVLGILAVTITAGLDTSAPVFAEANILRAHLGYAQSMAMANNTAIWSLLFSGNSYTLQLNAQPSPVPLPGEASPTHLLPADVQIVQGSGVLTFDQWGAPPVTYIVGLSDGAQLEQVTILGMTGLIP